MQPWRDFVIIAVYDISNVSFLRMSRNWEISVCYPFLSCLTVTDEKVTVHDGFNYLVHYLTNPHEVGYVPCPVQLLNIDGMLLQQSDTICARSIEKAVFKVLLSNDEVSDNVCYQIVKAFKNKHDAVKELTILNALQRIDGIPKLLSEELLGVRVTDLNKSEQSWHGFVTKQYCHAFVPSLATANSIREYARILVACSLLGYVNNDVSNDNFLLFRRGDNDWQPMICDWGLATNEGVFIGTSGTIQCRLLF
jgi:hypothetical protein